MLRLKPPVGVPARPFIHQFARSDVAATNPTTAELIRSGDLADRVVVYRHDLNFGAEGVPAGPHQFLSSLNAAANYARVARGAQQQIASFFASDGAKVIHPLPAELWEVPIKSPLPEDLLVPAAASLRRATGQCSTKRKTHQADSLLPAHNSTSTGPLARLRFAGD
jgi:hypothetical protein